MIAQTVKCYVLELPMKCTQAQEIVSGKKTGVHQNHQVQHGQCCDKDTGRVRQQKKKSHHQGRKKQVQVQSVIKKSIVIRMYRVKVLGITCDFYQNMNI